MHQNQNQNALRGFFYTSAAARDIYLTQPSPNSTTFLPTPTDNVQDGFVPVSLAICPCAGIGAVYPYARRTRLRLTHPLPLAHDQTAHEGTRELDPARTRPHVLRPGFSHLQELRGKQRGAGACPHARSHMVWSAEESLDRQGVRVRREVLRGWGIW